MRKRAPVRMPWLNMTSMAPSMPSRLLATSTAAKMPAVTKPMWLTLEYATSFLRSFCIIATKAPYRMPTTESITTQGAKSTAA